MAVNNLPIGLASKKRSEVRMMALNMLLWSFWAELTRTLKKTKVRRKPKTTEVAVKPDTKKKKTHSFITIPFNQHQEYRRDSIIKHILFNFSYILTCVFFSCSAFCFISVSTKPKWVRCLGVASRQSEQSNSKREKKVPLSLCTAEVHAPILGLEGLGRQPKNCGSVHWMGTVFTGSTVLKKQYALSELHLRKHPGTGQGPTAEGGCHSGVLSHWCVSSQKPWELATEDTKPNKGRGRQQRKKSAVWIHNASLLFSSTRLLSIRGRQCQEKQCGQSTCD